MVLDVVRAGALHDTPVGSPVQWPSAGRGVRRGGGARKHARRKAAGRWALIMMAPVRCVPSTSVALSSHHVPDSFSDIGVLSGRGWRSTTTAPSRCVRRGAG